MPCRSQVRQIPSGSEDFVRERKRSPGRNQKKWLRSRAAVLPGPRERAVARDPSSVVLQNASAGQPDFFSCTSP